MKFAESFQSDQKNHEDFCISQWQFQTKSLSYVNYRWIVASLFCSFMAGWFIQDFINNTGILIDFIYLTNLSLLMSTVTMVFSAYLATSYYNRTSYTLADDETKKFTLYLFEILSSTSTLMAILVSVNYWRLIHNPKVNAIDFNNISEWSPLERLNSSDRFTCDETARKFQTFYFSAYVWFRLSHFHMDLCA